jgi:hypothetical protein
MKQAASFALRTLSKPEHSVIVVGRDFSLKLVWLAPETFP